MTLVLTWTSNSRLAFWTLAIFTTFAMVDLQLSVLTWKINDVDSEISTFAFRMKEMIANGTKMLYVEHYNVKNNKIKTSNDMTMHLPCFHGSRFYSCLCNSTTESCVVEKSSFNWVSGITPFTLTNSELATATNPGSYLCEVQNPGTEKSSIHCGKVESSKVDCMRMVNCSAIRIIDNNVAAACNLEVVELVWNRPNMVRELYHDDTIIHEESCEVSCNTGSLPLTLATLETSSEITRASTSNMLSRRTDATEEDEDDGDAVGIIIGAVVGAVILVALLAVIDVVLWRCKRNAIPGANSGTEQNDPGMDGTPYAVTCNSTNTDSAQQIVNSPSEPEVQEEISADIYAVVDPAKKTLPNGGAKASDFENHAYYNQDDVSAMEHRQSGNSYTDSNITGQQDRYYYNLGNEPTAQL